MPNHRHQDHLFSKEFEMKTTIFCAAAMLVIGSILGYGVTNFVNQQAMPINCTKLGIDTGKTLIEKFK